MKNAALIVLFGIATLFSSNFSYAGTLPISGMRLYPTAAL